ncbi:MAG: hypothetical protein ABSD70_19680 [Terracidiphilus sp.]
MSVSDEIVRQEVSGLYRFIEPLVRRCAELREDYPVYDGTSLEFFGYFEKLGRESLQFLEQLPDEILKNQDPRLSSTKRQKLLSLRSAWEDLHQYLRPALDADALHLPIPLIAALHDRLHETKDWRSYRFTLFHTDEANYFQLPSNMVGDVANHIAAEVGGTQYPAGLGHIQIPYSQADGLFLNTILAHEMGHFIYQEYASHDVEVAIDTALGAMEKETGELNEGTAALCEELVSNWVQEVFCDLFAICLIGPAFSFAFLELIAASMLIGQQDGEPDVFYRFEWEHPADVARFHYHKLLLEKLGWWQAIRTSQSAPVQVLNTCARRSKRFTVEINGALPKKVTDARLLRCFDEVCTSLVGYVPSILKRSADDVVAFKAQSPTIGEYLRRAVIPSSIIIGGKRTHPTSVVLINAGYMFLLEELPTLLANIENEKSSSVESRSRLSARLELWLLKALEDHRLLRREPKS